ncbi:YdaS family helix-turn-helix protein [Caballeronia zhejiangensis]|uniref:YdaS family helix-turn-helix protein n=1 Tax=Caballeronia zhejiangensis TaxID=871203 RepID=UPI00158A4B8B|nr:YdaS family helix-turn-helix protein [Caballeronia zhejiangensis]
MSIIKQAVEAAGGARAVSQALGIGRISVYEWIYKDRLPKDRVIQLAELTGWKYSPHALAPKLYPNPGDGKPVALSGNA